MKHINAKIQATFIHTLLCLLAFSIVLYLMLTQWFPIPFFAAEGGWQALRIVLFVDIVLGPCLTFLVFSPEKSRLAIFGDLSFIALVQIAALTYGIQTAYSNRVIAISYLEHKQTAFPLRGDQIELQELSDSDIQKFDPTQYPALVYSQRPHDGQFDKITDSAKKVAWGIQEFAQIELMSPFNQKLNALTLDNEVYQINYEGSFADGTLLISSEGKIIDLIITNQKNKTKFVTR